MERVRIPRFIDSQATFWWWEMDEIIVAMGTFAVVGILMKKMLMAIVCMWVCGFIFKKLKGKAHRGAILHKLYWMGLLPLTKKFNNGQEREFGG